jgi:hypothetical protein
LSNGRRFAIIPDPGGTRKGEKERGASQLGEVLDLLTNENATATQQLLAMCVRVSELAPDAHEIEIVQAALSSLWLSLAGLIALERTCTADSTNPGYVKFGPVLAPFYLLDDIPSEDVLVGISDLAARIQLGSSMICLSGSACLLRTMQFIADLDFCEYVSGSKSAAPLGARVAALALSNEPPLCQSVKFIDGSSAGPWPCPGTWASSETVATLVERIEGGSQQLKLDFVAELDPLGVIEATNVALFLNSGDERAAASLSYAAQELPIAESEVRLARPLADPIQLGRYIKFLREEVERYRSTNLVKALKRALSLARILLLPEDAIVQCLAESAATLSAAVDARRALDGRLATSDTFSERAEAVEQLRRKLQADVQKLEQAKESESYKNFLPEHFKPLADSALSTLIDTVDKLIASEFAD